MEKRNIIYGEKNAKRKINLGDEMGNIIQYAEVKKILFMVTKWKRKTLFRLRKLTKSLFMVIKMKKRKLFRTTKQKRKHTYTLMKWSNYDEM